MTAPLCQYDVLNQGDRRFVPVAQRRPPCRRASTHVVRDWHGGKGGDDCNDLFVCTPHTAAMVKLNPDDEIEPERIEVDRG